MLGKLNLQAITREKVKALAMACLKKGQSPKTVQNIVRCLSSLFSHAVEDNLVAVNPALKPGKFLPKISKRRKIDPLTREEVVLLLETAKRKLPRYYPLFLCAARTGLRMGELLALQWQDVDWQGRFIEVRRNFTHWQLTTPKSGESRRVAMSRELAQTLKDVLLERQIDAGATGTDIPLWIFPSETGGLLHPHNIRDRVLYGLLTKAKLRRVRFHDLRHTFASLLLQNGESPVYVKEQMGHSSIQVTVDCYGHLIPGGNKQAVDRLDTPISQSVLERESATPAQPMWSPVSKVRREGVVDQAVIVGRYGVSDGFRSGDFDTPLRLNDFYRIRHLACRR
jgi:integrase